MTIRLQSRTPRTSIQQFSARILIKLCVLLSLTSAAFAADSDQTENNAAQKQEISEQLKSMFPRIGDIEIEESSISGIYQFWIGADLNYVQLLDGHIMLGEVFDTERKVSLAQEAKSGKVIELVDEINESEMIVFAAENEQRVINVFTDVDCGYCRRLHREVADLNEAGVTVRYIAFPAYSRDIDKHVSVWCADNPIKAMTNAKSGGSVAEVVCKNTVQQTLQLGATLGFRGTPQIIYDDGQIIGGYRPSDKIIEDFGLGG